MAKVVGCGLTLSASINPTSRNGMSKSSECARSTSWLVKSLSGLALNIERVEKLSNSSK